MCVNVCQICFTSWWCGLYKGKHRKWHAPCWWINDKGTQARTRADDGVNSLLVQRKNWLDSETEPIHLIDFFFNSKSLNLSPEENELTLKIAIYYVLDKLDICVKPQQLATLTAFLFLNTFLHHNYYLISSNQTSPVPAFEMPNWFAMFRAEVSLAAKASTPLVLQQFHPFLIGSCNLEWL